MSQEGHLQEFKSHLNLIKSMSGDKAEDEFYNLMEKAKTTFGDLSLHMGEFYFEYAKFLLEKMEKNIDIFNAGSLPVGQEADNPILEDAYEAESDNSDQSEVAAKSEANPNAQASPQASQKKESNDDQPIVTQQGEPKQQQNNQENANGADAQAEAPEDDDFEVCASNLLCAIRIFETERDRLKDGGEEGKYSPADISRWVSRCKSRLGDLYQLGQNYLESINVYREVVADEEKKEGHEINRGLAQIHYMIANSFLYDNKEGCEKSAIDQYIKSVTIMVNYIRNLNPNDVSNYEIPTFEKVKVDRFAYLPGPTDTDEVKQIKEVISLILDKIEDAFEQIGIRAMYEAEKKKLKEQEGQGQFKQVSENTPVVKLGTFGNRKKAAPAEIPDEAPQKKQEK